MSHQPMLVDVNTFLQFVMIVLMPLIADVIWAKISEVQVTSSAAATLPCDDLLPAARYRHLYLLAANNNSKYCNLSFRRLCPLPE
jgi:hypothetical protein